MFAAGPQMLNGSNCWAKEIARIDAAAGKLALINGVDDPTVSQHEADRALARIGTHPVLRVLTPERPPPAGGRRQWRRPAPIYKKRTFLDLACITTAAETSMSVPGGSLFIFASSQSAGF